MYVRSLHVLEIHHSFSWGPNKCVSSLVFVELSLIFLRPGDRLTTYGVFKTLFKGLPEAAAC